MIQNSFHKRLLNRIFLPLCLHIPMILPFMFSFSILHYLFTMPYSLTALHIHKLFALFNGQSALLLGSYFITRCLFARLYDRIFAQGDCPSHCIACLWFLLNRFHLLPYSSDTQYSNCFLISFLLVNAFTIWLSLMYYRVPICVSRILLRLF